MSAIRSAKGRMVDFDRLAKEATTAIQDENSRDAKSSNSSKMVIPTDKPTPVAKKTSPRKKSSKANDEKAVAKDILDNL